MGPITPDEIPDAKTVQIPNEIFDAFNELIVQKWRRTSARVYQKDVVALIEAKAPHLRADLFEKGYLDVEDSYRKAGWIVVYDKPGYCESYGANFTFSKKGAE